MSSTYTIEGAECIAETDNAIRVSAPEIGTAWIPKNQVHYDSEVFKLGGKGELVVSQWFAEQRGWV